VANPGAERLEECRDVVLVGKIERQRCRGDPPLAATVVGPSVFLDEAVEISGAGLVSATAIDGSSAA